MRGRKDRGAGRPRSAGRLAAFVLLAAAAGTLGAQIPDPWRGPDARDLVEAVEAAMVNVEPGVFVMGSDRGLPDSRPAHSVALTKPFRILRHEVTFEEYDAYCALAGARSPKDNGWGRGRQPVIDVSFADAVRFCNFLSRAAGRTPCYDEETWVCNFDANG
ncbi:MAG TPA: SUMF1/EgtB/PvdO family nonheme iron enzyme, partial [Spirochaetia bacterium]|nr:SUMF1/EgtB/PvdO family nonheme iron enzyme [Spirochaetia bacterium]